jgi:uncharacterized protein GlcG (DUF336 family)
MRISPHGSALCLAALCCLGSAAATADDALSTFKAMKPDLALKLAQATMQSCRKAGYQVAVAVVDRSGIPQVVLRDQLAGAHTPDTAQRKAWTAVSFSSDTQALANETEAGKPHSGIRFVTGALMVGGGVPVMAAGSMVGGVGVSGSPSGEADQKCAEAGIEAIEEDLLF